MMQSEFIERTGFEPTAEEYQQIEEEYMGSVIDKDEFCKQWKKNGGVQRLCRMRARKIEELERELRQKDKDIDGCEEFWSKKMKLAQEQAERREDHLEKKCSELNDEKAMLQKAFDEAFKKMTRLEGEKVELEKQINTVREAFKILGISKEA